MTALTIVAVALIGATTAGLIALNARVRAYNANRPTTTGGRHPVPADYNPLAAAVRQDLAPTANADVALPAGPDEITGRLTVPGGAA